MVVTNPTLTDLTNTMCSVALPKHSFPRSNPITPNLRFVMKLRFGSATELTQLQYIRYWTYSRPTKEIAALST